MSVQQKQNKTKTTTLLHFHVTKMAIINSAVKELTTNMEPPLTQKKKQTNKQKYPLSSPITGMSVGVVCHWKVGNYNEGGEVWVESVCHIYI